MTPIATKKILLVGSIPHPIGGVTQAIWRLIHWLHAQGYAPSLLDMHPGPRKYPLPDGVSITPVTRLDKYLYPFRLLPKLYRAPVDVVHYHFSSILTLRFFGPALTFAANGDRAHVLTLHHGDQSHAFLKLDRLSRAFIRRCIHRFSHVIALSDLQYDFYRQHLHLPDSQIIRTNGYIPPPILSASPQTQTKTQTTPPQAQDHHHERHLISSGYPSSVYGYEHMLDLMHHHGDALNLKLTLCLYGHAEDPVYAETLKTKIRNTPRTTLLEFLDFDAFMTLLHSADLYVRPSYTDSTGIAIADCIHIGLPVVASDCTFRYPGTLTFPTGQQAAFESLVTATLSDLPAHKLRLANLTHPDTTSPLHKAYGGRPHPPPR